MSSFTYDQSGHGNGVGHLTSLTDQAGSLSRSYDERGNITTDARDHRQHSSTPTAYTYESAGRLSSDHLRQFRLESRLHPRQRRADHRPSPTTQPGHGAVNLATSVTHMPFGPALSLTYGNGVTDARTFDLDYRMTAITDHGTANIQYLSYGYDADNNVHTITDNVTAGEQPDPHL